MGLSVIGGYSPGSPGDTECGSGGKPEPPAAGS